MKTGTLISIIGLCVAVLLGLIAHLLLSTQVSEQQRQIDQLAQMTVTLARIQGAEDNNGFMNNNEYCFFFADYSRGIAIVGKFDGEIHYNKKPQLVILHGAKEELLRGWDKAELCYGYKKIR